MILITPADSLSIERRQFHDIFCFSKVLEGVNFADASSLLLETFSTADEITPKQVQDLEEALFQRDKACKRFLMLQKKGNAQ